MAGDIDQWLEVLDLTKYRDAFAENEIAFGDLAELTENDLKEIGLPMGPRRRALRAIAELGVQRHGPLGVADAETPKPSQVSPAAERRTYGRPAARGPSSSRIHVARRSLRQWHRDAPFGVLKALYSL